MADGASGARRESGGYLSHIYVQIFEMVKNQRGPLEIGIFLLRGVNEGVGGGQEPSKTLLRYFYKRENKI